MAAVFIEDTIQASSMEATPISARRAKGGIVKNIDTLGNPDRLVMDKALAAIMAAGHAWNEQYPSGDPDEKARLGRIFIYPITFNMCRVILAYDIPQYQSQASYIIRDSGYMQGFQGNILPGTGESIKTGWEEIRPGADPDTGGSWTTPPARVPDDFIPMSFSVPARSIGVNAVIYGTPPAGLADAQGYVNDALWYGRDKGYWRVDQLETDIVGYAGYYTYTVSISTRNYKDWSETGVLKSQQTGRYVPVDDTELAELLGRTYSYGVMQGGTGARAGKAGIVRVCPFPETDLSGLLGF